MYQPLASPAYERAPITEAVVEVRVAGVLDEKTQEKIAQRLKKKYSNLEPIREIELKFDTTGGDVGVTPRVKGSRLSSDDQLNIVLLKPNSLSTSRLAPYQGWDEFATAAKDNWSALTSVAPAMDIRRVGVRYINRLDIPGGRVRLEDFVTFFPQVDAVTENPISQYVIRTTFPAFKENWLVNLTSTLIQPAPVPQKTSILLDIDVYRTVNLPVKEDALWAVIGEARIVKNDLFERITTARSKELFR